MSAQNSLTGRGLRLGIDQIANRFGLCEIDTSRAKRTQCKFARIRHPGAETQTGIDNLSQQDR